MSRGEPTPDSGEAPGRLVSGNYRDDLVSSLLSLDVYRD